MVADSDGQIFSSILKYQIFPTNNREVEVSYNGLNSICFCEIPIDCDGRQLEEDLYGSRVRYLVDIVE